MNVFCINRETQELIEHFSMFPGTPFGNFSITDLVNDTSYSTVFENRSVAYYGTFPYYYGKTMHQPSDISANPYLLNMLNHVKEVVPNVKFNSAMVTKYVNGNKHSGGSTVMSVMILSCP